MFFNKKIGPFPEAILVSTLVGMIIPLVYLLKSIVTGVDLVWGKNFVLGFLYSFTVTFCIYFFNVRIVHRMQQSDKFQSHFNRILFELIITTFISSIIITLVYLAFLRLYNIPYKNLSGNIFENVLIAVIVNLISVFIIEAIFFFKKWKNSLVESEQLKRKNMEIQYAALTSQVNPHFLFNSLNTLSSLIQADPDKAVVFTREFAKIYRYVLDSKDKLIVTLQEELNFLYSFLYLQKIRFDKGLEYQIEVNSSCLDLLLPPLSLQLLVENAIKHNEISEENPLVILIRGMNEQIIVSNNFRPVKKMVKKEGGIGLKNLVERYAHYSEIIPEFTVENDHYVAKIPLIKDE